MSECLWIITKALQIVKIFGHFVFREYFATFSDLKKDRILRVLTRRFHRTVLAISAISAKFRRSAETAEISVFSVFFENIDLNRIFRSFRSCVRSFRSCVRSSVVRSGIHTIQNWSQICCSTHRDRVKHVFVFWSVFFENYWSVLVCFGLFWSVLVRNRTRFEISVFSVVSYCIVDRPKFRTWSGFVVCRNWPKTRRNRRIIVEIDRQKKRFYYIKIEIYEMAEIWDDLQGLTIHWCLGAHSSLYFYYISLCIERSRSKKKH